MTPATRTVEPIPSTNRPISYVHQISRMLFSTLDLDKRLLDTLTVSMEAVDATAGSILTYNATHDCLLFEHVVGEKANVLTGTTVPAGSGICGKVYQSGRSMVANTPAEMKAHYSNIDTNIGFSTRNMVTVPIRHDGKTVLGVLQLLNKRDGDFTDADVELLETVAAIASAAIRNAHLQRENQAEAVANLVSIIAHEVKNKTTLIRSYLPMMEDGFQDVVAYAMGVVTNLNAETQESVAHKIASSADDVREYMDVIMSSTVHLNRYSEIIANAAKGKENLPLFACVEITHEVEIALKDVRIPARSRQVELKVDSPGSIDASVDSVMLKMAIFNLVNNAIPETPSGGSVTIRIRESEYEAFKGGRCLLIEVQDTGKGMPKKILDQLLVGEATSTKAGGTGLGTKLIHDAVKAHGGILEGESEEGKGTTLRMKLPLNR